MNDGFFETFERGRGQHVKSKKADWSFKIVAVFGGGGMNAGFGLAGHHQMKLKCGFKRNIGWFVNLVGEVERRGMSVPQSVEAFFETGEIAALRVFFEEFVGLGVFHAENAPELSGCESFKGAQRVFLGDQ